MRYDRRRAVLCQFALDERLTWKRRHRRIVETASVSISYRDTRPTARKTARTPRGFIAFACWQKHPNADRFRKTTVVRSRPFNADIASYRTRVLKTLTRARAFAKSDTLCFVGDSVAARATASRHESVVQVRVENDGAHNPSVTQRGFTFSGRVGKNRVLNTQFENDVDVLMACTGSLYCDDIVLWVGGKTELCLLQSAILVQFTQLELQKKKKNK